MGRIVRLSVSVVLAVSLMMLTSCFLITGTEREEITTPAPTTTNFWSNSPGGNSDDSDIEKEMLDTLNTIFADTATVYYGGDMGYIVVPEGGQRFADEVQMAKNGNSEYLSNWQSITSMVMMMSKTMAVSLPGYALSLVNPVDTGKSLYTVVDGVVIYDVMYD